MSVFNEIILTKVYERSESSHKNLKDEVEGVLECLRKFENDFLKSRSSSRDKAQKDKLLTTTLQSIDEDDDDPKKQADKTKLLNGKADDKSDTSTEGSRGSKKRSKSEVEGILSPELDKRQKRGASVRAQTIISKQVNVNLTQKLRREDNPEKQRSRRNKEDDKENEPLPPVQIKQEKVSLPPEPMDLESIPITVPVKQEPSKDDCAMPPPAAPLPKGRKVQKDKSADTSEDEANGSRRRNTRNKKQTDAETMPPPAAPSSRSTRASARSASSRADDTPAPPADVRTKRTRTKKKVSESTSTESVDTASQETGTESPAAKPRPKRTRRGQKAQEPQKPDSPPPQKQPETPKEPEKPEPDPDPKVVTNGPKTELISPKEERLSQNGSPLLQKPKNNKKAQKQDSKEHKTAKTKGKSKNVKDVVESSEESSEVDGDSKLETNTMLEQTRVIEKLDATVTITNSMDQTMVLPNGVFNHVPVTPKTITSSVNETLVIEKVTRGTFNIEKPAPAIMDSTVVIDKDPKPENVTDDNSLLTDDSEDFQTPPNDMKKPQQPTSAVKEKVQQFEELAQRTTRTKTRAMAKKDDETDNQTPPDKLMKPVLSSETLTKMNNMIFNGKQISSSACKPRALPAPTKATVSASKAHALSRHRDAADEGRREKEDALRKKEALLEAKRDLQKRRREEKMAAAAAARAATERERRAALQAAERERGQRQAQLDQGRAERRRDQDRKKQELARKVAETEERRKAEEQARLNRLAEEQRRAEMARKKQIEDAAALKKEEAKMAKEIEKRQKEYLDKQKLKRSEDSKSYTPLKGLGPTATLEPVYMLDGFQYLNSDEEDESPNLPIPEWSTSQARRLQLSIQAGVDPQHEQKLFSVRVYSPDLRDIFPSIERARLKRTSSAVWRTPPRMPTLHE